MVDRASQMVESDRQAAIDAVVAATNIPAETVELAVDQIDFGVRDFTDQDVENYSEIATFLEEGRHRAGARRPRRLPAAGASTRAAEAPPEPPDMAEPDVATAAPAVSSGETIVLRDVSIRFGRFTAVQRVDLEVGAGEFVCLLGPSGCGKSTVLNAVAGFLSPARGEVLVGGEPVVGPDVNRGVVFQSSEALFPWLSVAQNVSFGPRMRGLPRDRQRDLVSRHLEMVGLAGHADRYPAQLSGGMRQRVQIARVLANEPSVVLMDEPFGALDAQTREVMQRELDRIWRETRCTIVFVTHDITEAILLADRIATMTAGPAARIKRLYDVDLAHPRDEMSEGALALYRTLREDIGAEVDQTLRNQGLESA